MPVLADEIFFDSLQNPSLVRDFGAVLVQFGVLFFCGGGSRKSVDGC